jgi:hypothetical protein
MNAAHLHLLLNHVPVLGSLIGAAVLIGTALSPRQTGRTTGLVLLIVAGVFGAATYLTGEPAEEIVERLPNISHDLIHEHEEAAEPTVWLLGASGALALVSLVLARRRPLHRGVLVLVVALAALAALATLRTAALGGHIHHPETRPGFQSPAED